MNNIIVKTPKTKDSGTKNLSLLEEFKQSKQRLVELETKEKVIATCPQ